MRILPFIMVVLCLLAAPSLAQNGRAVKPDLDTFGEWPVLHEGRIKTMRSFAQSVFYDITGTDKVRDMAALEWLVNSLFEPASTIGKPFIAVRQNAVLDLPDDEHYHSMASVMMALNPHEDMILSLAQRDPSTYSASQREVMHAYQAVSLYNQIIQSFGAVLPLQGYDESYLDGGGDKVQRGLIQAGGEGNALLKIIPSDNPSMPMISVWQAVSNGQGQNHVNTLRDMARAWNEGDYKAWNEGADTIRHNGDIAKDHSLGLMLEDMYLTIQPIIWVIALYLIGCIVFFKSSALSLWIILGGFLGHIVSLTMRSVILSRPPTGTLYETLLFGSAVIVFVGLIAGLKNRQTVFFTCLCAASAAFLLFVSRGFIQGDSLNVLVAVLNTNFWLSTHVTCIIIGYGFCIMTAMIAHLVLAVDMPRAKKLMLPLALASLLFTSVGTLLGGIWADQSWGRFWGWDPKENGALLIVLWLAWVLHGRVSGHFRERGFAAALALTNIMVALTWFGVNLLGIGLHSYGFISGVAWGLGGFVLAELVIVGGLYWYPQMRRRHG